MRRIIGRRITIVAAGALAVAAAAAGLAAGAIPSASDGVIHACHQKPGLLANPGDLRVIDKEAGQSCRSNETPLSWNQQGEPGPQGARGEPGPKGDPGPPSLADIFETRKSGAVRFSGADTTIHSLSVPAGHYLVHATLTVNSSDHTPFGSITGLCRLTIGESLSVIQSIGPMNWTNDASGLSDVGALSVSLQGVIVPAGATHLRIRCSSADEGDRMSAYDTVITATRIGRVHVS